MLIVHDLNFCSESPTVTALGFFDGVHKGHRAVIAEARAQAHARGQNAPFLPLNRRTIPTGRSAKAISGCCKAPNSATA